MPFRLGADVRKDVAFVSLTVHDTWAHVTLDRNTSAAIVCPFVANSMGWKKWQLWLRDRITLVSARLRRGIFHVATVCKMCRTWELVLRATYGRNDAMFECVSACLCLCLSTHQYFDTTYFSRSACHKKRGLCPVTRTGTVFQTAIQVEDWTGPRAKVSKIWYIWPSRSFGQLPLVARSYWISDDEWMVIFCRHHDTLLGQSGQRSAHQMHRQRMVEALPEV